MNRVSTDRVATTLCHRLPGSWKVGLALTVIVAGLLTPVSLWPVYGVLGTLVFMGHTVAGVPVAYLARRMAIFLPFLFLLSVSLPAVEGFRRGGDIMAAILLRGSLSFLTILWLIRVLPFEELLHTLIGLRVPPLMVSMLAFMHRYAVLLWTELNRMHVARHARTFGRRNRRFQWKQSAQMIGMLLIRAITRAERVHQAMCARGWNGHFRQFDRQPVNDRTSSEAED
ncbi:MAG: energy-coupling factor transporter transmembrane component T [Planctomycetaceae bacterium]